MASELWVKLGNNYPAEVSTNECTDVYDFLKACKKELKNQLDTYDPNQLTLSTTENGPPLEPDAHLPAENTARSPLFIRVVDNSSSQTPIAKFERRQSDEKFIQDNNLDLYSNEGFRKYAIYLLEKEVDVAQRHNTVLFNDNCLEYRLDRRTTTYQFDGVNDVKVALGVSGAGKTRMLLELLHSNYGYFFTFKTTQNDFGSNDITRCMIECDNAKETGKVGVFIKLLFFTRVTICNYLIDKGFNTPGEILFAQLHPVTFFGFDAFDHLYTVLRYQFTDEINISNPFPFTAIDEIQRCVESAKVHKLPGSKNPRPFFSPLVYYSKGLQCFPHYILSGTGINYSYFSESLSTTMKIGLTGNFQTISTFEPLSEEQVVSYATQFLQEHQVQDVSNVVSRLASFKLCHGRPRFIAFILDEYMETRDIEYAINKFAMSLSDVDGDYFPLKFFKRDLDNKNPLLRVVELEILHTKIERALIDAIWYGNVEFLVDVEESTHAILYGVGYGKASRSTISRVEISEPAIIECLRYLFPFAYIIKEFLGRINSCPKPQMVGYLLEYLVAFALVANNSGLAAASRIEASRQTASDYLLTINPSEILFPDHMCGPDIIYKCSNTNTVYIVQVKYVKRMSKQEAASACDTTNPSYFYCKRNTTDILKGFEKRREELLKMLSGLQKSGYTLQKLVVIHSEQNLETRFNKDVILVTRTNSPGFFDKVGEGVWGFLDRVRQSLN